MPPNHNAFHVIQINVVQIITDHIIQIALTGVDLGALTVDAALAAGVDFAVEVALVTGVAFGAGEALAAAALAGAALAGAALAGVALAGVALTAVALEAEVAFALADALGVDFFTADAGVVGARRDELRLNGLWIHGISTYPAANGKQIM